MVGMDDTVTKNLILAPDFRIITTLRHTIIDEKDRRDCGPIVAACLDKEDALLHLHSDRLKEAASACGWHIVAKKIRDDGRQLFSDALTQTSSAHEPTRPGCCTILRTRVVVDRQGGIVSSHSVMEQNKGLDQLPDDSFYQLPPSQPINVVGVAKLCTVYMDDRPTTRSIFTSHKTTYRVHYDEARSRRDITHCSPLDKEIILFNEEGAIMEASLCTTYFQRNGHWVVPSDECGGNRSVTRRWAIERGFCVECKVLIDEITHGELIWLSNAVRGFFLGRIVL